MKTTRARNKTILISSLSVIAFCIFIFFLYLNHPDAPSRFAIPPANALYVDSNQSIENRVEDLLSYMTLEEKIGQMTLIEKNNIKKESDIVTYNFGALLSGGGSKPNQNTPEGWARMIAEYQTLAEESRLGIPLLYGADAVHGHAGVPTATVFPHSIGLGATHNFELVEKVAQATAQELFATGVNWNFSPTLDQPQDIRWGRVYEAFSDDSLLVSQFGSSYVKGLQTNPDSSTNTIFILATLKHYLGLGSMEWNTSLNPGYKIDQGTTQADNAQLRSRYLPPFQESIDAGALSIMIGLNRWGDKKMVLQKELLTDILKKELGFKGFLVSDWFGVHEGRKKTFWATVEAINAGVDMVMLPFDYEKFARHVKWAHRLGLISNERIDDAVGRILYAKFSLGLFDTDRKNIQPIIIPNIEHQLLAREAVAGSLVLLKNQNNVLPLSPDISHIQIAGSAADNVGAQMGGWTIEWQGVQEKELAEATSILEGIKMRVSSSTLIEYNAQGNFSPMEKKAPIGIAIVGEKPYAEGVGDIAHPILSDEDLRAIKNLQTHCEQVVVVLISGRPLLITNEIDSFDALVAAWLPGSEGEGIADVLFGDKPFTGTLPLPWPQYTEQFPISEQGITANQTPLLFERGFGLKY